MGSKPLDSERTPRVETAGEAEDETEEIFDKEPEEGGWHAIVARLKAHVRNWWLPVTVVLLGLALVNQLFTVTITPKIGYATPQNGKTVARSTARPDSAELQNAVLPADGVELPIRWGDLGRRAVADGVIDDARFRAIFGNTLPSDEEQMLSGAWNGKVVLNVENSQFLLDVLWAIGLGSKNDILARGEMTDSRNGGDPMRFASTAGWTIGRGSPREHYGKHEYVTLTPEQQALVDRVSRGIYRPCCGNSTHFPDCNHGMAMLGLLEMMAANGVSETEMYRVALLVNSYWFPQTYVDLAAYFREQGQVWTEVDPKVVLSSAYSSAQGYQATRQKIQSLPEPPQNGGGCGV